MNAALYFLPSLSYSAKVFVCAAYELLAGRRLIMTECVLKGKRIASYS